MRKITTYRALKVIPLPSRTTSREIQQRLRACKICFFLLFIIIQLSNGASRVLRAENIKQTFRAVHVHILLKLDLREIKTLNIYIHTYAINGASEYLSFVEKCVAPFCENAFCTHFAQKPNCITNLCITDNGNNPFHRK